MFNNVKSIEIVKEDLTMEILSLGEKIKKRRKELNMTLKDLAGNRITPGQISLIESGKSNPSMDLLQYLTDILNISIEYLMETEKTQAEKNCIYFQNIAESYIMNKDLIEGEKYIDRAIYFAEEYNLEYRKAKNLYLKSKIFTATKQYSIAQQYLLSANVIFIENNNYMEIVNTFMDLGKITMELKSYHSSNSYFRQAEKVCKDSGIQDDFLLGQIYYNVAFIYFKLEKTESAMNYSYLAKEKFNKMENRSEYARLLLLLADECNKKNDLNNAIRYSKEALVEYKSINDLINIAKIENNLGQLFYEFDNVEESFIHLNKSKKIRIKLKDESVIETIKNICENYIKLKDIKNANEALEELRSNIHDGSNKVMLEYYLLKYRIDMLQGKFHQAENILLKALNFAKNMEFTEQIAQIAIFLGKFYMDTGNNIKAAAYLSEGVDMFKTLGIIDEP